MIARASFVLAAGVARSFLLVLANLPGSVAACQTPPAAEPFKPVWLPEVNREIQAVLASVEAEEAKFAEPPKPHDKEWVKRKLQHMVDVDQMVRTAFENPRLAG